MTIVQMPLINKSTLVDDVENHLIKYLIDNGFKPGDPMPKEIELAESLGVSRSVIREALSRLRMLGILKSYKRRGLEVATPDILIGFDRVIIPQILDPKTMQDLFELRLILELGLSEILFLRKTEADITELRQILKKEKGSKTRAISIDSEVEFHGKLYDIAGNSTLHRMQSILWPVFEYLEKLEIEKGEKPHLSEVSHSTLVDIIENGTPQEYQDAIKKHLEVHLDRISNEL
jgi:GntR family transcriptional repressor for pyruvate dehydrogenase complex